MADRESYIAYKIKKLKEEGYSNSQSAAIAYSMEKDRHKMQQGGSSYNYQKAGNTDLNTNDIASVRDTIGLEFTPEFASSYFSKDVTQNPAMQGQMNESASVNYSQLPIQDITSDNQWSNRKVWRTQRPEWFVGKKQPVEGQDYTTVPYSQWNSYQTSPEYLQYTSPQVTNTMQQGGEMYKPKYAQQGMNPSAYTPMEYPNITNNYFPRPNVNQEMDFSGTLPQMGNETVSPLTSYLQPSGMTYGSPAQQLQTNTQNVTPSIPPQNAVPPNYNDITRYNVLNPYGGVDLGGALSYAGQGFGSGNAYQATLGTGLSVLKGARNFLTGYASGKESDRVKKEQYEDLYNPKINYQYAQQGGEISNAQILTGEYVTDEPGGNYNLENGEYIKRAKTGDVKQVVGDPHIQNGKVADGVDVNLQNGDKVLSDYTKIPAKNVKELKERYDLSLRKNATFADAQKAYDKKLGIQKETDDLTTLIERFGKNSTIKDETTQRLNDVVLSKEIAASKKKLDLLGTPQSMMFEDLFNMQEMIPKRGDGSQLYDKNGKEVKSDNKSKQQQGGNINIPESHKGLFTEQAHRSGYQDVQAFAKHVLSNKDDYSDTTVKRAVFAQNFGGNKKQQGGEKYYQEGGELANLAQKYGISLDRARELLVFQEGGEIPTQAPQEQQAQPSPEEVMQFIAQALQEGADPQQVLQQMVESGIPQELAVQMIEQIMQQMPQEGDEVEQEVEENDGEEPDEDEMDEEDDQEEVMQQGGTTPGFSFSTRISPTIAGYDVSGNSVINQDQLTDVEPIQSYTGKGYGKQMANIEDLINLHSWYFDTPEKKDKFRNAAKKEGAQQEVIDFQNAYNTELRKRAEKAGVPKKEANKIIEEVGFSGRGAKKFDGLLGAFTTTRPLYNFAKKDGEVEVIETPISAVSTPTNIQRNITKGIIPMLPDNLRLAPSAVNPLAKEQIALGRLTPTKFTTEPMLAEQERLRQTDVARLQASGLPAQQQEALLSQGLASSQMAANDAIMKTELANQANLAQVEQFNLGQRAKEDITNSQYNQQYQQQMLGGLNAYESALRNYYNQTNLDNEQKYRDIESINLLNAQNENYQYIPGSGVQYLPTQATNLALPSLSEDIYAKATPEEINAFKKRKIAESRAQGAKNYTTSIQKP